ncbi:MAG: lysostaphin resistance A-like protein [Planctomycetota bacterium]
MRSLSSPSQLFNTTMTTHGLIALVAVSFLLALNGPQFFLIDSFSDLFQALLLGIFAGGALQVLQWLARKTVPIIRNMSALLETQFEGWTGKEIFFVALISSISEELLFRALIQPYLGLWLTSLIFGLAHWTGVRELRIWVPLAFLGGLFLGALAESSLFGIPGSVAAHFTINLTSLWILTHKRGSPETP